jgi:hypothetical protein
MRSGWPGQLASDHAATELSTVHLENRLGILMPQINDSGERL